MSWLFWGMHTHMDPNMHVRVLLIVIFDCNKEREEKWMLQLCSAAESVCSCVWKRDWVPLRAHLRVREREKQISDNKRKLGNTGAEFSLTRGLSPGKPGDSWYIWLREDKTKAQRCTGANGLTSTIPNYCIVVHMITWLVGLGKQYQDCETQHEAFNWQQ